MREDKKANIVLVQNCKPILLSRIWTVSDSLFWSVFKRMHSPISNCIPCQDVLTKIPHLAWQYNWSYCLTEYTVATSILQDLSEFCRGQNDVLNGDINGDITGDIIGDITGGLMKTTIHSSFRYVSMAQISPSCSSL